MVSPSDRNVEITLRAPQRGLVAGSRRRYDRASTRAKRLVLPIALIDRPVRRDSSPAVIKS